MTLPTARLYIEGIHVTHDWDNKQWDELARMLRGRHRAAGHPGDVGHWIEYPVIEGGEPCVARIHAGDVVTFLPNGQVEVRRARDYTVAGELSVGTESEWRTALSAYEDDLKAIALCLGDSECDVEDIREMAVRRIQLIRDTDKAKLIEQLVEAFGGPASDKYYDSGSGLVHRAKMTRRHERAQAEALLMLREALALPHDASPGEIAQGVVQKLTERDDLLYRVHGIVRLMHNDDELRQWVADHMKYRNANEYFFGKAKYVPMGQD